jgi:hypothetical protein
MASLRKHLASMGLAVVVCHLSMQVLVAAALCCRMPESAKRECCAAGSHPGQVCPMHGSPRAAKSQSGNSDCRAQAPADVHNLYLALSGGGVIPSIARLVQPAGSEEAPPAMLPTDSLVPHTPPGPPPRA